MSERPIFLHDPVAIARVRERVFQGLSAPTTEHPVIASARAQINNDPVARMYIEEAITQARYRDKHTPADLEALLRQLNAVLATAPTYIPPSEGEAAALVGTPFSAVLLWLMGAPSGFGAFRYPVINDVMRQLLEAWTNYLDSEASTYVLNETENGWMSHDAQSTLHMQDYVHDSQDPKWGFKSWNGFFTRKLVAGARPIDAPEDTAVITAACDSQVYRIADNLRAEDRFWTKGQPYSLQDALDFNYVDEFVGGSVFQAFLSPFNYHRWHSPVSGTIRKAFVKPGLLFSQVNAEGEDLTDQDHSEGYLAHVQTRALIFIEADDPVGLVCVMPIGMVEISSCIIDPEIRPGARVTKGQELGYFQFGGSTHCVFFRPGVIDHFTVSGPSAGVSGTPVKMGQKIAVAGG